jgi:lysozyme
MNASVFLLTLLLAGSAAEPAATGVDVSRHSGEVDWAGVAAAGHQFAFIKSSEGVDLMDPAFQRNWAGASRAGLLRGAYHFYVTEDDPEAQASFFLETVQPKPGDLLPVIDVEQLGHGTDPGWVDGLKRFLALVEEAIGAKPILYTSPRFWNEQVGEGFGDDPLCVAEYEVEQPRLPAGWSS